MDHILTEWIINLSPGVRVGNLARGVPPCSPNLDPIPGPKMSFSTPIFRKQTRVINMTYTPTKRCLKIRLEFALIALFFSFIWNWSDYSKSSIKHPLSNKNPTYRSTMTYTWLLLPANNKEQKKVTYTVSFSFPTTTFALTLRSFMILLSWDCWNVATNRKPGIISSG